MGTLQKELRYLSIDELCDLSEAIVEDLDRRLERREAIPDSARRRYVNRRQSYRRRAGSTAPPIRVVGLKNIRCPRVA